MRDKLKEEIEQRKRGHRLGVSRYSSGERKPWFTYETRKELLEWAGISQGLLIERAGENWGVAHSLGKWLADHFNHNFDAYDKAIDSVYLSGEGSSSLFHHLLDGNHTIWGALKAVHDVRPDDSLLRELFEAGEHLIRDMFSVSGINPLFSLSRDTFNNIAHFLAPFGVSKLYIADALSINAIEVTGGLLGVLAVFLGHKSVEMNAEIAGSLIFSAIAGANPLMLPVAGFAIYKAIRAKDWTKGEFNWEMFCRSIGKGALVSGAAVTVSSVVSTTMPLWLALTAGITTAFAVKQGIGTVERLWPKIWPSFEQFGTKFSVVAKQIAVAPVD